MRAQRKKQGRAALGRVLWLAISLWGWKAVLLTVLGAAAIICVPLCAGIAAALQASTLPWPVVVPEAGQEASGWLAGGWRVTSGYGWRSDPFEPSRKEFHDGVDLAGRPFCLHCRVPSLFDAQVRYIGWDPYRRRGQPADRSGGGIMVELQTLPDQASGAQPGELVASYAHLAPYRLLVQLQGRIVDPWDRDEYRAYADYRELGDELLPALDAAAITVACASERSERVPEFVPQRIGPASYIFLYDKPIVAPDSCSVSVVWPERGEGWTGWIPDDPAAGPQPDTAVQSFATPLDDGRVANDVALRFRAHLGPPPPEPTPVAPYPPPGDPVPPYPAPTAAAAGAGGTERAARRTGCLSATHSVSCSWSLADLAAVTEQPALHTASLSSARRSVAAGAQAGPDERCGRVQLVQVPARASDPRMTPDAAAAWHRADALISAALGYPWLRQNVSDIMRPVDHVPTRSNQILQSWHKTGRAVDVPQSGRGLRVVQEGAYQRLFVDGVDITSLMVAAGFGRIPSNPGRQEWWHFELHGGLTWQGAMAQLYPISLLRRLYPSLDWTAFTCQGEEPPQPSQPGSPDEHEEPYPSCSEGVPSWSARYEELDGCGPPLSWSSEVRMLDDAVGHIGLTGATTAAHLHLSLRQRSAATVAGAYPLVDVCEPPWLPPELQGRPREEINRTVFIEWKADCYTPTVDPLDFLPRANAGPPLPAATAAPLDGEPAQLPPPGTEGALVRPGAPGSASTGEYWSPFGRYGRFGGGGVLEWLRGLLCSWLGIGCDGS